MEANNDRNGPYKESNYSQYKCYFVMRFVKVVRLEFLWLFVRCETFCLILFLVCDDSKRLSRSNEGELRKSGFYGGQMKVSKLTVCFQESS